MRLDRTALEFIAVDVNDDLVGLWEVLPSIGLQVLEQVGVLGSHGQVRVQRDEAVVSREEYCNEVYGRCMRGMERSMLWCCAVWHALASLERERGEPISAFDYEHTCVHKHAL